MTIDYDRVELDTSNPEPRCPCVLPLDTSSSMSGSPITQLNAGLQVFREDLCADDLAMLRVEVAVVTFGGVVNIEQDFVTADQFQPPMLSASGDTPMGAAINVALDHLEARKQIYSIYGLFVLFQALFAPYWGIFAQIACVEAIWEPVGTSNEAPMLYAVSL